MHIPSADTNLIPMVMRDVTARSGHGTIVEVVYDPLAEHDDDAEQVLADHIASCTRRQGAV